MFYNIANNPLMRTQLLDDKALSRFQQIRAGGDPPSLPLPLECNLKSNGKKKK